MKHLRTLILVLVLLSLASCGARSLDTPVTPDVGTPERKAGGTIYRVSSDGLAPTPVNTYVLVSDGEQNIWKDPTTIDTRCCDLDEAYDARNTIDYTGATTSADAVILSATTADNPDDFLRMLFDTGMIYEFQTDGDTFIYNPANGVPTLSFSSSIGQFICGDPTTGDQVIGFEGYWGTAVFNVQNYDSGDFTWKAETPGCGIFGDASADTVTVVQTEYIGAVDTAGYFLIADGAGHYTKYPYSDLPGAGEFLTCSAGALGGIYQLDWAVPAGGAPGGNDTYVQYNDSGAFGGESTFTYTEATNTLYAESSYADTFHAGDADTSGYFRIYDGDAEYGGFSVGDIIASYDLIIPPAKGAANQIPYTTASTLTTCTLGWQSMPTDGYVLYPASGVLSGEAAFKYTAATDLLEVGSVDIDGTNNEVRVGADQGAYDIQTDDDIYAADDITAGDDITATGVIYPTSAFRLRAYNGSDQNNITANTWTEVNFDNETFDGDGVFNTTTHAYTPTYAGYYHLRAQVMIGGAVATQQYNIGFYINNALVPYTRDFANSTYITLQIDDYRYLDGDDYVEVWVRSVTGNAADILSGTQISYFTANLE